MRTEKIGQEAGARVRRCDRSLFRLLLHDWLCTVDRSGRPRRDPPCWHRAWGKSLQSLLLRRSLRKTTEQRGTGRTATQPRRGFLHCFLRHSRVDDIHYPAKSDAWIRFQLFADKAGRRTSRYISKPDSLMPCSSKGKKNSSPPDSTA
jgi:hypothetical protein